MRLLIIDITPGKHFEMTHCIRVHLFHTFSPIGRLNGKKIDSINFEVIDHIY